MNKITISVMALGVMLVAVGFAIQPVQQAEAVHTTIQANVQRHFTLTGVVGPDADATVLEAARWAIPQPFRLIGVTATFTVDTGADCNLDVSNIRTNLIPEAGVVELDPAAINLATDTRNLLGNADGSAQVHGSTVLEVGTLEGAACDADARATINATIETTGALTAAPAATIAAVSAALANGLAAD